MDNDEAKEFCENFKDNCVKEAKCDLVNSPSIEWGVTYLDQATLKPFRTLMIKGIDIEAISTIRNLGNISMADSADILAGAIARKVEKFLIKEWLAFAKDAVENAAKYAAESEAFRKKWNIKIEPVPDKETTVALKVL